MHVLDLGSGTGFSAQSFLDFFSHARLTLVEPDPAMLEAAAPLFEDSTQITSIHARAENFEFSARYDLVLVGSAWHWMDRAQLIKKFETGDVGGVFIFEYQFPKAKAHADLNEWVRRAFNLKWRTLTQEPRGNLTELTQGLRDSLFFAEQSRVSFLHEEAFDLERFWGMIISQSRFLAYEETLPVETRVDYRKLLLQELALMWGLGRELQFILPYEGDFFLRRKI